TKFRKGGPKACWPWIAKARQYFGYGAINAGRGNLYNSHVVAYALANGPIPVGSYILHSCDNPGCCNPAHLRVGNKEQNTEDMEVRKRLKGRTGPLDPKMCAKKLNDQLANEIRESQLSRLDLAKAYGVSPHTISNIKAGRTYARSGQ
ncbi:MAG: HNH endonuclease, partial [Rhizobiaceae bacterium]|nr:HNH endonuclease [Desulfitobacteriaceae bacterium]MDI6838546.1 HNH endonuclease [Rhizobiaceae bacterium]